MRTLFKILAIIFALAALGSLTVGELWPLAIILALVFGYFGWCTQDEKQQSAEASR